MQGAVTRAHHIKCCQSSGENQQETWRTILWLLMANCIPAQKTTRQQSPLVTCITTIAQKFFAQEGTTVLPLPNEEHLADSHRQDTDDRNLLLGQLHASLGKPIVVSGPGQEMCPRLPKIIPGPILPDADWDEVMPPEECEFFDKRNSYILFAHGQLREQLERLKSYYDAWNARGRFLVVLERPDESLPILEELRQWKVVKVVVLTPSDSEEDTFDLYSWFPYRKPSSDCGKLRRAVLVDKCVGKGKNLLRSAPLSSSEVPADLGGCPITVSTFPLEPHVMLDGDKEEVTVENDVKYTEGLDIRLFNFMARRLNASVKFLPPPTGDSETCCLHRRST